MFLSKCVCVCGVCVLCVCCDVWCCCVCVVVCVCGVCLCVCALCVCVVMSGVVVCVCCCVCVLLLCVCVLCVCGGGGRRRRRRRRSPGYRIKNKNPTQKLWVKKHLSSCKNWPPRNPLIHFLTRWCLKNIGSMGRDICPRPGSFILGGWVNTFYVFGFSRIPGNVQFFSGEYPSLKKYFRGGWADEMHIIFGKWILYILLRESLVPLQGIHFSKFQIQHISAILWLKGSL